MSRSFQNINLSASGSNIFNIDGETAQTIQMARRTIVDSAGNDLTIIGGGVTIGATDKNGGSIILQPGVNTGNSIDRFIVKIPDTSLNTGTNDNVVVERSIMLNSLSIPNKTNTNVIDVNLNSGEMASVTILFGIECSNGNDHQAAVGNVTFRAINKAGTITTNVSAVTRSTTTSGSSITITWSATTSTNKFTMRVNSDSSLPGSPPSKLNMNIDNFSKQTITLL